MDKQVGTDVGAQPLLISGMPGRLPARIVVRNLASERRLVRCGSLNGELDDLLSGGSSAPHLPQVMLEPGQARSMNITLKTDPHAPPGEYKGNLDIGGVSQPVIIHILEQIDLGITPSSLVVLNQPGRRQRKRVVLQNLGNVALRVGEIGPVALDDELFQCRVLRAAAKLVGDDDSVQDTVATILRQARKTLEQSGFLRVYNPELLLRPGESKAVDLDIRVPDTLAPRGRYRGTVALYTSNLDFWVVPGELETQKDPGAPTRSQKAATT
jgi:hypothetical protein